MATSTITLKLTEWPEAIYAIRSEIVRVIRSHADAEADPRVAKRLRDIAVEFEIGLAGVAREDSL